jgi:hypothetical protein
VSSSLQRRKLNAKARNIAEVPAIFIYLKFKVFNIRYWILNSLKAHLLCELLSAQYLEQSLACIKCSANTLFMRSLFMAGRYSSLVLSIH